MYCIKMLDPVWSYPNCNKFPKKYEKKIEKYSKNSPTILYQKAKKLNKMREVADDTRLPVPHNVKFYT